MSRQIFHDLVLDLISDPIIQKHHNSNLGPVFYFGKLKEAEIATISINPSHREFVDKNGLLLTGSKKRFETLPSLGRTDWNNLTQAEYDQMTRCFDEYFENNPYRAWFDRLEQIINFSDYSYYKEKIDKGYHRAAHLDLFAIATYPIWRNIIIPQDKEDLMKLGLPALLYLLSVIKSPSLHTIVLNGSTVINWFEKILGVSLPLSEKEFLTISGSRTSVKFYETTISSLKIDTNLRKLLSGCEMTLNEDSVILDRPLRVVAWSCYVQNTFGKVLAGPDRI